MGEGFIISVEATLAVDTVDEVLKSMKVPPGVGSLKSRVNHGLHNPCRLWVRVVKFPPARNPHPWVRVRR